MWKKHYLATAAAGLLLATTLIPSGASAAVATKNLQAKYNNVKVLYNGSQVATTIEPFIVDGTTYIPLRMMAGVFNKDITWDGNTYTINVLDKADFNYKTELAVKDAEIARLKNQISSLQDEIDDLENKSSKKSSSSKTSFSKALSNLEDDLNDDYGKYEGLKWSITLDGDEDEIEVEIAIDMKKYGDDFDALSKAKKQKLVKNIIEDVWDEFDADVTGVIYDTYDDEDLHKFYADYDDDIYFDKKKI